jgi:hypothetical protein
LQKYERQSPKKAVESDATALHERMKESETLPEKELCPGKIKKNNLCPATN